jgi:beta-lactamase family protein
MIHISDNNAATTCWSIVGDAGLNAIARAAGMTDFSVSGFWLTAMLSPADQARFFFEMDTLIPREFVGYARFLLSTIEPSQTWGVAPVARPLGYRVFFKDGSEPTGLGQLVHQVARLERHGRTLAMAVMTDGDPTMQYGIDTISGVAGALLR